MVGFGTHVNVLKDKADEVKDQFGFSCEVIDLRTLLPWDQETVIEVSIRKIIAYFSVLYANTDMLIASFGDYHETNDNYIYIIQYPFLVIRF